MTSKKKIKEVVRASGLVNGNQVSLADGENGTIVRSVNMKGVNYEVIHLKRRPDRDPMKRAKRIRQVVSLNAKSIWIDENQCELEDAKMPLDSFLDKFLIIHEMREKANKVL